MGLAQAVSLPRGGGTLKGQRFLPAPAGPPLPLPAPPLPLSWLLDPFPRGTSGSSRAPGERAREAGRRRGLGGLGRAPGERGAREVGPRARRGGGARGAPCQARGGGGEQNTGSELGGGQGVEGESGRVPLGARCFLGQRFAWNPHKDSVRSGSSFPFCRQKNRTVWQVARDQAVKLGFQLACPAQVLNPGAREESDISLGDTREDFLVEEAPH